MSRGKPLPDLTVLHRLLEYNPFSGVLTWRVRDPADFIAGRQSAATQCGIWNKRFANQPALTAMVHGYRHGHILGGKARAHRVIWKWMTGEDPDEIDHINGDRSDNRWVNLRDVSRALNGRNVAISKRNTSGVTGVVAGKRPGSWYARAVVDGKSHHIGSYASKDEARMARARHLEGQGFTSRHLCMGEGK